VVWQFVTTRSACMCVFDVLGYLVTFGKAATEQVAKTAKQFRETVEEKVTKSIQSRSLYSCILLFAVECIFSHFIF